MNNGLRFSNKMSIKDTPLRFYLLIMLGFWTCTNNNISAEHQNVLKDLGNRSSENMARINK